MSKISAAYFPWEALFPQYLLIADLLAHKKDNTCDICGQPSNGVIIVTNETTGEELQSIPRCNAHFTDWFNRLEQSLKQDGKTLTYHDTT